RLERFVDHGVLGDETGVVLLGQPAADQVLDERCVFGFLVSGPGLDPHSFSQSNGLDDFFCHSHAVPPYDSSGRCPDVAAVATRRRTATLRHFVVKPPTLAVDFWANRTACSA